MFEYSSLVESRCPCRDVGEAIPVGSLRPIRTARETLGGRTLERPSCGGFVPTAETTLFPAYSARSRRLLTSSVRLDNEPNFVRCEESRMPTQVQYGDRLKTRFTDSGHVRFLPREFANFEAKNPAEIGTSHRVQRSVAFFGRAPPSVRSGQRPVRKPSTGWATYGDARVDRDKRPSV